MIRVFNGDIPQQVRVGAVLSVPTTQIGSWIDKVINSRELVIGMFVRIILLAGSVSTITGYVVCFILRKLGSQAARIGENWLWIVLLGVGLLGASLFTEHILKISSAAGKRPVARVVLAAAAAWLPYALLVSLFAPQVFGFTELSFFLSPLAALGGSGLIIYQATDEFFPDHLKQQLQQEERLKKILWIFVTADVYWFLSCVLLLLLLITVFFIAAIVVSVLGFLQPDILAIEFVAGLLLGGGVLGYSVWRLSKRARLVCRTDAHYKSTTPH